MHAAVAADGMWMDMGMWMGCGWMWMGMWMYVDGYVDGCGCVCGCVCGWIPSWAAAWRDPHRREGGRSCCAAMATMLLFAHSLPGRVINITQNYKL